MDDSVTHAVRIVRYERGVVVQATDGEIDVLLLPFAARMERGDSVVVHDGLGERVMRVVGVVGKAEAA